MCIRDSPIEAGDRVLDVCAAPGGKATELGAKLNGSGVLIAKDVYKRQALSRGAREAGFVENNTKAMMCVKDNLKFTKLEGKAVTLTTDVMNALYKLEG